MEHVYTHRIMTYYCMSSITDNITLEMRKLPYELVSIVIAYAQPSVQYCRIDLHYSRKTIDDYLYVICNSEK